MKDVIVMDTLGREITKDIKEKNRKKTRTPRIAISVILGVIVLLLFGAGVIILNTTEPFLSLLQPGFGFIPIISGSCLIVFAIIGLIGFITDQSVVKALGFILTLAALVMFILIGLFYAILASEAKKIENGEFASQDEKFGQDLNDIAFAALDVCCGVEGDFNLTCGENNSTCVFNEDFKAKAEKVIEDEDLCDLLQTLGLEFNNESSTEDKICQFDDPFDFILKFGETVRLAAVQAFSLFLPLSIFAFFAVTCTFCIDLKMNSSIGFSKSRREKSLSQISQTDPTEMMAFNEIDQRATLNNL